MRQDSGSLDAVCGFDLKSVILLEVVCLCFISAKLTVLVQT